MRNLQKEQKEKKGFEPTKYSSAIAFMGTKDEDTMYQGANYCKADTQWRKIYPNSYETKDSQDNTNDKDILNWLRSHRETRLDSLLTV